MVISSGVLVIYWDASGHISSVVVIPDQQYRPISYNLPVLIILTTSPGVGEAERLAEMLVEKRLAACVQILPEMRSFYWWEGEVKREPEHLLLIKTSDENWDAVRDRITEAHSYDVPELVAIDAEKVSGPYAAWLAAALRG